MSHERAREKIVPAGPGAQWEHRDSSENNEVSQFTAQRRVEEEEDGRGSRHCTG